MPCRVYSFLCNNAKNAYYPCIIGEMNWAWEVQKFAPVTQFMSNRAQC